MAFPYFQVIFLGQMRVISVEITQLILNQWNSGHLRSYEVRSQGSELGSDGLTVWYISRQAWGYFHQFCLSLWLLRFQQIKSNPDPKPTPNQVSETFGNIKDLIYIIKNKTMLQRLLGATVARLTPDQKVACSNHVGVNFFSPEE